MDERGPVLAFLCPEISCASERQQPRAKPRAKLQGLTHVSSSAATAERWPTPLPNLPVLVLFRATTDSRSLPTLGCFRMSRGAGSPPRKPQGERRARDGTLFHIRAAVGQRPINSPDAVAGSSACQGGPDEKEHSSKRTSKEGGKCADAVNVQAQIPSRDAAFPAEGSGHLCRLHESGVVDELDVTEEPSITHYTSLHIFPFEAQQELCQTSWDFLQFQPSSIIYALSHNLTAFLLTI